LWEDRFPFPSIFGRYHAADCILIPVTYDCPATFLYFIFDDLSPRPVNETQISRLLRESNDVFNQFSKMQDLLAGTAVLLIDRFGDGR
jgi:hypothetical protein